MRLRRSVARYGAGQAREGGGIILYLDQEGRGNGIANKMRAYKLQSQGFDTYDADEVLGFGLDQRRFDFAAEMLRQLGVTRSARSPIIRRRSERCSRAGLEVVSHERVLGRPLQRTCAISHPSVIAQDISSTSRRWPPARRSRIEGRACRLPVLRANQASSNSFRHSGTRETRRSGTCCVTLRVGSREAAARDPE